MKTETKLWPLESEQGFEEIWPSDLVFELTWPIFKLDWEYHLNKHSGSFMKTEAKPWPLQGEQGFKEIWPSDIIFDPTWPIFKIDQDIVLRWAKNDTNLKLD